MGQARWRDRFGPPSLVLSTGLMIAVVFPSAISAGPPPTRPAAPTACTALDLAAAARGNGLPQRAANVQVESMVDADGVFSGRTLAVQPRSGRGPVAVTLPAESFVSPALGDLVVYGSHRPGDGSEVFVVDAGSGCGLRIAQPAEVVRSAILDPSGAALYLHSVTEADRRDLGVIRLDLVGGGNTVVLEPIEQSAAFGRTFSTEMRWSIEGDALAVQSCGPAACRTRVLDIGSGEVRTHDDPPHGTLIGVAAGALYTLGACHWSPCSVLAIDRASGHAAVLFEEAYGATLSSDAAGLLLTVETPAGTEEVRP